MITIGYSVKPFLKMFSFEKVFFQIVVRDYG